MACNWKFCFVFPSAVHFSLESNRELHIHPPKATSTKGKRHVSVHHQDPLQSQVLPQHTSKHSPILTRWPPSTVRAEHTHTLELCITRVGTDLLAVHLSAVLIAGQRGGPPWLFTTIPSTLCCFNDLEGVCSVTSFPTTPPLLLYSALLDTVTAWR